MPRLIVKTGAGGNGRGLGLSRQDAVLVLTRVRTTLGRSARNDLCLEDPFTSRLHAEIRRVGDTFWINDLGSANGTYLNGIRLFQPVALQNRDQIRVGETEIEFSVGGETSPTGARTNLLMGRVLERPRTDSIAVPAALDPAVSQTKGTPSRREEQRRAARVLDDPLALLGQVSQTLLSRLSLEETLGTLLERVFDVLPADRGLVFLLEALPEEEMADRGDDVLSLEGQGARLVCKASKVRSGVGSGTEKVPDLRISQSITHTVMAQGAVVLTTDAQEDPRFSGRESIVLSGLRSVMAVPLAVEGRVTGMLYVDTVLEESPFTERDLQILTLIAGVAAIRVENMALLELQQEQQRLADELELASEIQLGLHPANPPSIEGYDLVGVSFPCYEVGGDYYDFIEKSDGRHVIAVGDVSGKGTGAALLMSSVHAAVRAHTRTRLTAGEVVAEINRYIHDNTPPNRYVTLFYSELDPRTHHLRYINAGHNPPILLRKSGEVARLDVGGFPVGILPSGEFKEGGTTLSPGDVLVIFSDGATESLNEAGEEFDEERLIEVVLRYREDRAAVIRDRIDEALTRFVGKAKAVDDLTMVIVKRHF